MSAALPCCLLAPVPDIRRRRAVPAPPRPPAQHDEFLVVASDGLWDVLPPREAVQWARKQFKEKKVGPHDRAAGGGG